MVQIKYDSVRKEFGNLVAVEDFNLEIDDGEFVVLLGPSGCGKTTTLRCLAGLESPSQGKIAMDGHDVTGIHPKNRNIAMVFQQFALYPHLNVRENIGYPLKVAGVDAEERSDQIKETGELLDIDELLDRDVDQLSGGQRQRVALGRAIIREPNVFLMDEPLASLDAKLKVEMRSMIKVIQRELGITTVYVTHDQEEAMSLGDKLVVMNEGSIQQIGTADEVYHEPVNQFVASFIGSPSMNFIEVTIDDAVVSADTNTDFQFQLRDSVASQYEGYDRFELGVRPQYFDVQTSSTQNAIPGTVNVTEPLGDEQLIEVLVGEEETEEINLTVKAPNNIDVRRNDSVWLTVQSHLTHGFDLDSGERITDTGTDEVLGDLDYTVDQAAEPQGGQFTDIQE